jgi:hypothetical protein
LCRVAAELALGFDGGTASVGLNTVTGEAVVVDGPGPAKDIPVNLSLPNVVARATQFSSNSTGFGDGGGRLHPCRYNKSRLSMYEEYPVDEVSLEDFELYAVQRLRGK